MILVNLRLLTRPMATRRFRVDSRHGLLPATLITRPNSFFILQRSFSAEPPKNVWLDFVKRITLGKLLGTAFVFAIGSIPLNYAYVAYVGYKDARALKLRLEQGSGASLVMEEPVLIDRPELEKDLQYLLTPSALNIKGRYYLITGEHGTGKTTAVMKTCRTVGSGVIYVNVPKSGDKFAGAFAEATGYKPRASGLFPFLNKQICGDEPKATDKPWNEGNWDPIYRTFEETVKWYKAKYHKIPVLVIDNVNRLAKENPQMLAVLQEGAKDAIDRRQFVTVFVSSDGMAPQQITERSAFSRGKSYHIGDINQDQVFEYLQKRGVANTDGTLYSRVFDLVGGRLNQLSNVSDDLIERNTFEDVKKALFAEVRKHVRECLSNDEDTTILQAIVKCTLEKPMCDVFYVQLYLKKDGTTIDIARIQVVADRMTSANLVSKVEKTGWIFHSNVERSYFKENPQVTVMPR